MMPTDRINYVAKNARNRCLALYRPFVTVCAVSITLQMSGCASVGDALSYEEVKPWERGALADDGMQPVLDAMDKSVDEHIYFSREASTGGSGVRGGGCGCN